MALEKIVFKQAISRFTVAGVVVFPRLVISWSRLNLYPSIIVGVMSSTKRFPEVGMSIEILNLSRR
jgi:hypothetical protein